MNHGGPAFPSRPRQELSLLLVASAPILRARLTGLAEELPGLQLSTAESRVDALERTATRPFDAIVIDVDLREGDGLRAISELRRATPAAAILTLGFDAEPELPMRCGALGADAFFLKPCGLEPLARCLSGLAARTVKARA